MAPVIEPDYIPEQLPRSCMRSVLYDDSHVLLGGEDRITANLRRQTTGFEKDGV